MNYIIRLAYKNLSRNLLRTLVSIVAIAFAVMIVVFARGFIVGMIDSLFADHVQYSSGHVKIVTEEYSKRERLLDLNHPVDGFAGEGLEGMVAELEELEDVELAAPRLKFGAMATSEEELFTMIGYGVNPDKEKAFTGVEDLIKEGRFVNPGEMEIVMGTGLLEKLNQQVGNKITLVYNTSFNSLKGATFKIVGRIESGLELLNENIFYLPLDQAQRLLYMEGQATELLLIAPRRQLAGGLKGEVEEILAGNGAGEKYLALSYEETSELLPYMELAKTIYNAIYIFLVLLACIVVINTMVMIVQERTKEIGMMKALGLDNRSILLLFVIEGGAMGVIGSLLGALAGGALTAYLARTGINFAEAMAGLSADLMFNAVVHPVSSVGNVIFAFVLGSVIVTISCIFPARRAARLEPTEALRDIG